MTNPSHTPDPRDWSGVTARMGVLARALTGDAEEAQDLVQEAVVRILSTSPEKIEHAGYAAQTLTRLWLTRQRSLRRRVARLARLAFTRPVFAAEGGGAEAAESAAAAWRAIDELPPRQRAAIVLRLVEQRPYEQIAEVLGCDVGAVRSNLHAARAKVRAALGEEAL